MNIHKKRLADSLQFLNSIFESVSDVTEWAIDHYLSATLTCTDPTEIIINLYRLKLEVASARYMSLDVHSLDDHIKLIPVEVLDKCGIKETIDRAKTLSVTADCLISLVEDNKIIKDNTTISPSAEMLITAYKLMDSYTVLQRLRSTKSRIYDDMATCLMNNIEIDVRAIVYSVTKLDTDIHRAHDVYVDAADNYTAACRDLKDIPADKQIMDYTVEAINSIILGLSNKSALCYEDLETKFASIELDPHWDYTDIL